MKKGDRVTIFDGSYTRSVINGKLKSEYLNYGPERGKKYVIIETDCSFPRTEDYQPSDYCNDTVIQAINNGKVVFINHKLLTLIPIEHDITIDGKMIRISHESFLSLREQLL